ncbi:MAG: hypothetical protein ACRCX2_10290 [Paraclostridium sp.]
MIDNDKLVVDDARDNCEVIFNSEHKKFETDRYVLFAKANGENHIEVNGLDIEEIEDFVEKLNEIIKFNREKFE